MAESRYDGLPLHAGLKYVYDYQYSVEYRRQMGQSSTTSDSGTVEYSVIDSTTDSYGRVQWTVVEKSHLFRRVSSTFAGSPAPYWIDTSLTLTLSESTVGLHSLSVTSRVWRFPLREDSVPIKDSVVVMRYLTSTSSLLRLQFLDATQTISANDTVQLESLRGVTRFTSYSNAGTNYTGTSYMLRAQLK